MYERGESGDGIIPWGYGTMIYPDGAKFVGKWRLGLEHGKGTEISSQGEIVQGFWREGELKRVHVQSRRGLLGELLEL